MAPRIEVVWDSKSSSFLRNKKMARALKAALGKAGKDALRAMRAEAKRQVRSRVRIRAGFLADRAFPLRPRPQQLEWAMLVSGHAVPLGEYPRRQTRKGVSVEVKTGQRALIQSAFLATTKSGRLGVFLRPSKERYPMGHRLGLNVADTMKDGRVPAVVLQRGAQVLDSAFARLLPLELGKLG